ncbi:MAG: FKBP-type peptidyl-prolyl cis-trans isomerase [Arenicella sp.]|jgi:FKBP-type peptidyl-prolyl cis-trans isomerase|nr:FKBP-type peptidyl-prolyl cis-trans isomerase [Arenicella sp.]
MTLSLRTLALIAVVLLGSASFTQAEDLDMTTDKAQLGYTYGVQIGQELVNSGLAKDIELAAVLAAITDITSGKESKISLEQQQAAQQKYQDKQIAAYEVMASTNKAMSDAYMVENAKKAGVKTTESGLQYEILREGKGAATNNNSMVKVHYTGKMIDGSTFDSSYDRGEPATFSAGAVIPGFSEGLQLMKEGGKIRLHIPADMAYGDRAPESIGPNQALIFEVELIEVKDAPKPAVPTE